MVADWRRARLPARQRKIALTISECRVHSAPPPGLPRPREQGRAGRSAWLLPAGSEDNSQTCSKSDNNALAPKRRRCRLELWQHCQCEYRLCGLSSEWTWLPSRCRSDRVPLAFPRLAAAGVAAAEEEGRHRRSQQEQRATPLPALRHRCSPAGSRRQRPDWRT